MKRLPYRLCQEGRFLDGWRQIFSQTQYFRNLRETSRPLKFIHKGNYRPPEARCVQGRQFLQKLFCWLSLTIIISSLLTNAESWYNLTLANIVVLEKIDEQMLRGILNYHWMTSQALLYLELGCQPEKCIIAELQICQTPQSSYWLENLEGSIFAWLFVWSVGRCHTFDILMLLWPLKMLND